MVDYCLWNEYKALYFKAIQAGLSMKDSPMMQLLSDILSD
ncbi:cell filamentation protein Fic [Enterobacter hormaechei]|nr:cell filamentation protein Fic [Enterobacter hormaechei]